MNTELLHISKAFGEKKVITDLSVVFPEGEVSCIMAPSGTGKTTVLNLIMGLIKPDSGEIIGDLSSISAVFQDDCLCESFSAFTNVRMAAPKAVSDREIRAMLSELGLKEDIKTRVSRLSGGMKRRVAIARAIAAQAKLILLDEPFRGLDEEAKALCAGLLKKQNKTIIMVTHDASEVSLMGGTVLNIYNKK